METHIILVEEKNALIYGEFFNPCSQVIRIANGLCKCVSVEAVQCRMGELGGRCRRPP